MAYNPFNSDRLYTYEEMVKIIAGELGCDIEEAEIWCENLIKSGVITRPKIH